MAVTLAKQKSFTLRDLFVDGSIFTSQGTKLVVTDCYSNPMIIGALTIVSAQNHHSLVCPVKIYSEGYS